MDEKQPTKSAVRSGRIKRTVPVAAFAARAAGGRVAAALRTVAGDSLANENFHRQNARRYSEMLGSSKGVLMKAGQLLSVMDLGAVGDGQFSAYQTELERLKADAEPMDSALARETLENSLGRSVDQIFATFEEVPIAAASIGQVHRAWLPDGRKVAVKIQYPGVAQAIQSDLANTDLLASFIQLGTSLVPRSVRVSPRAVAAEIGALFAEETDYRQEAQNIADFAALYEGHPFIKIPTVIDEASSDRVITMSFVDGVGWAQARDADQDLKNKWAEALVRFALGPYRHASLFNADPHPGNYRFHADGAVSFVDFGCVKRFDEFHRSGVVEMVRRTIDGQIGELYSAMYRLGLVSEDSSVTATDAHGWWQEYLKAFTAPQPYTYGALDGATLVRELVNKPDSVAGQLDLPRDMVFLTRIDLGLDATLAQLRATLPVRAVVDELDGVGEPATELGRQHVAWARNRGLPFGMEPR